MLRRTLPILLLVLVPVAFVAGYRANPRSGRDPSPARRVLYYVDPMDPSFHSPKPGIAPCGMALEPVHADGGEPAGVAPRPGAFEVRSDRQQLLGVTVGTVRRQTLRHTLRLLGRVAADDTRLYRITAPTQGRVRELGPATAGSLVTKAQVLGTYYTPELLAPQQNLIRMAETLQQLTQTGENPYDNFQGGRQLAVYERNVEVARQAVINLGMTAEQVDEVVASRRPSYLVQMRAPVAGVVTSRGIVQGQWFEAGQELYSVADLRRVWVVTDAFEGDERFLRAGARAAVRLSGRSQTRPARVSEVLPLFDGVTRTLKVRLEIDNPGLRLRPDMFVDVEVPVELADALAVPVDAVVDSGLRKIVFVDLGNGSFEPRRVETGLRVGDEVVVARGLMAGERVVVSGNFLLDSESRMRAASSGIHGREGSGRCAVCDMDVRPEQNKAAKRTRQYRGTTYLFCSDECVREFDRGPERHAGRPGVPPPPMQGKGKAKVGASGASMKVPRGGPEG